MSKQEFLLELSKALKGLPQKDIEERLSFYSEMIDDRIEEGLSEEEAVSKVGSVQEIVKQTVADIPLAKIAKERIKPKRQLTVWEIVLLILGSPIWLSLGIAAIAVVLAIYASIWSMIISLWAVFASLVCGAFAGLLACAAFAFKGTFLTAFAILGSAIVFAGLSIFMFYGCIAATKGILILTKKIALWVKSCFIKKEEA